VLLRRLLFFSFTFSAFFISFEWGAMRHTFANTDSYIYTYIHTYIYMYVCMYLCMYVCTFIHTYIHTLSAIRMGHCLGFVKKGWAYKCYMAHTELRIFPRACIYVCIYTICMYMYDTYIHMYAIHTYVCRKETFHSQPNTDSYIYTYIHTYIYMYGTYVLVAFMAYFQR